MTSVYRDIGGLHCLHMHRLYSCKVTLCVSQSFTYFLKASSGDQPQRSLLLVQYYSNDKNKLMLPDRWHTGKTVCRFQIYMDIYIYVYNYIFYLLYFLWFLSCTYVIVRSCFWWCSNLLGGPVVGWALFTYTWFLCITINKFDFINSLFALLCVVAIARVEPRPACP